MEKFNRKRIGLIGCGNWGKQILSELANLGCEVAVVARSQQSVNNAIQTAATEVLSDIGELGSVHGLIIATSTETHFEVIEKSLFLEVPIYVEKPITSNLEQTSILRGKAAGRVFVMDKYRYHPAIKALAELTAKKSLGDIRAVKTRRQGWGISTGPVNCIWDLAPHELSIILTILGNIPELNYKHVDFLANKPIGFAAHFGSLPTATCEVVKGSQSRSREVTVFFSEGIATWNDKEAGCIRLLTLKDLEQSDTSGGTIITVSRENPLTLELKDFLAFLDGGPEPMSNLDDAYLFAQTISQLTPAS